MKRGVRSSGVVITFDVFKYRKLQFLQRMVALRFVSSFLRYLKKHSQQALSKG